MVSTALILLAGRYGPSVAIPCSIILAREIGVSALREWMAQRGLRDIVKVGFQGKAKTAVTMISLSLMLLVDEGLAGASSTSKFSLFAISKLFLYLCTAITVTSGSVYLRAALPYLLE
jgi:CDP-diacylglycerol---glycerol-3-phosphate 3-phosphatidyltransferase